MPTRQANGQIAGPLALPFPPAFMDDLAARVVERLADMLTPAAASPWKTAAEAAVYIRCTNNDPQRIYDLKHQRKLMPRGYDGSRPRYHVDDLDAFLIAEAGE